MISVCMAVCNGQRYLAAQLDSVLRQLPEDAEVIVVDDCSTDASLELIAAIKDGRIRTLRNSKRLGVVATFERAIAEARGELIFLCDQDDLWTPTKVERFVATFGADAGILLAISDARLIDGEGRLLAESFFAQRGGFVPGFLANLVRNRYLGCALAFRAMLKPAILPFPPDIPMHDMWIGTLAAVKGRVAYIDEALIDYRRHQGNASPSRHAGLMQMLIWRWRLAKNLLLRALRRRKT